jgi:hypothetical protein
MITVVVSLFVVCILLVLWEQLDKLQNELYELRQAYQSDLASWRDELREKDQITVSTIPGDEAARLLACLLLTLEHLSRGDTNSARLAYHDARECIGEIPAWLYSEVGYAFKAYNYEIGSHGFTFMIMHLIVLTLSLSAEQSEAVLVKCHGTCVSLTDIIHATEQMPAVFLEDWLMWVVMPALSDENVRREDGDLFLSCIRGKMNLRKDGCTMDFWKVFATWWADRSVYTEWDAPLQQYAVR